MGASATKVQTRTHFTAEAVEPPSSNVPQGTDGYTREQLEQRIRQLEAEFQRNVPVKHLPPSKEEKPIRKPPQRIKGSLAASAAPATSSANLAKVGKFCYNCGDSAHLLPHCTNPTNAVLVQKKLCERHQTRQSQLALNPQHKTSQLNLALNS